MQQELFLQRDELAHAHQLGELQKDYTTGVGKRTIALMGGVLLGLFIIAGIPVFISLGFSWGLLVVVLIFIATFVLVGLIVGGVYYYSRRLHIYVYTSGLLYLNRNKRRAVRWEQITRVSDLFQGSFSIYVKDEPRIGFGGFINQIGELYSTIEGEVDYHRPQQPTPSPGKLSDPGPQVPVYAGSQPGRQEGSHVQQELSLQRDELARAYQLGEFQKDYTIAFGKQIKGLLFGVFILLGTLIPTIGRIPILWTLILTLFYTLLIGSVLERLIYSYYRQLRVYLYTGGLLYLNGNKRTAVRWEQINNVSRGRGGAVSIEWGGPTEPRLRLSSLIDHIGGLYFTIKREVDTHRSSGQAQERKQGVLEQYSPQPESAAPPYYQGTMPASQFDVQPSYAVASHPSTRRVLWIILGMIGALVLIGGFVLLVILVAVNGPSPTSALNAYCSALKSGDYQTAYTQLSSGLQSRLGSEAQFAADFSGNPYAVTAVLGKMTNCIVSNVNDAAGSGTISYTYDSGGKLVEDYILIRESSSWEINGWRPRPSTTLTLSDFCGALLRQNYPTAYAQFSSYQQSQQSEAQFANQFTGDPVSTCMVSNVDDSAGAGSITRTYADGSSNTVDFTLIVENGTWKINTRQVRP